MERSSAYFRYTHWWNIYRPSENKSVFCIFPFFYSPRVSLWSACMISSNLMLLWMATGHDWFSLVPHKTFVRNSSMTAWRPGGGSYQWDSMSRKNKNWCFHIIKTRLYSIYRCRVQQLPVRAWLAQHTLPCSHNNTSLMTALGRAGPLVN